MLMKDTSKTVFQIFTDEVDILTSRHYQEYNLAFMDSYVDRCKSWMGNGDISKQDSEVFPIAVLTHETLPNEALIATTRYHRVNSTLKLQNIQTELGNKHGVTKCHIIETPPAEIISIIDMAAENLTNRESTNNVSQRTIELQSLHNMVVEAINLKVSDIHWYVTKDHAEAVFRAEGLFVKRQSLTPLRAKAIITAALYANSNNYSGVSDDNEMVDTSVELVIDHSAIGLNDTSSKKLYEEVTLRTTKTAGVEGPHTVMRIIRGDQSFNKSLADLDYDKDILVRLQNTIKSPSGIVLFTGPTGSGKSTGLAALCESIEPNRKIITLEDPVEYKISRLNTVQMAVKRGDKDRDYLAYLEKALRQDPDVIVISEMRSHDVMKVVVTSALTGHLMISTLHANDSIGAITRLKDEGLDPVVLSERNLLKGIVAQRLIPTLCPHCKVPHYCEELELDIYVHSDQGCKHCNNIGVKGRILIAEDLIIDSECRRYIRDYDLSGLETYIKSKGWKSMADRALIHIKAGILDPYIAQNHISNLFKIDDSVHYGDIESATVLDLKNRGHHE